MTESGSFWASEGWEIYLALEVSSVSVSVACKNGRVKSE